VFISCPPEEVKRTNLPKAVAFILKKNYRFVKSTKEWPYTSQQIYNDERDSISR
jgi:hypothetical protein